ncbi:MAG: hypothetical protein O9327_05045 [Polaromonas sp.]|nr:hypothetical protein [Polaromonas sp.]
MQSAHRSTAAANYRPASLDAVRASHVFIAERDHWLMQMDLIKKELVAFVRAHTGSVPTGLLAKDPLGMTVYGLTFEKIPSVGFEIDQGATSAGAAVAQVHCVPLTDHPVGQEVAAMLQRYGRTAEMRPLLNTIEGVHSCGIEGGRLVLTEARIGSSGVFVSAAPSAVHDEHHLVRMNGALAVHGQPGLVSGRPTRSRLN